MGVILIKKRLCSIYINKSSLKKIKVFVYVCYNDFDTSRPRNIIRVCKSSLVRSYLSITKTNTTK